MNNAVKITYSWHQMSFEFENFHQFFDKYQIVEWILRSHYFHDYLMMMRQLIFVGLVKGIKIHESRPHASSSLLFFFLSVSSRGNRSIEQNYFIFSTQLKAIILRWKSALGKG